MTPQKTEIPSVEDLTVTETPTTSQAYQSNELRKDLTLEISHQFEHKPLDKTKTSNTIFRKNERSKCKKILVYLPHLCHV